MGTWSTDSFGNDEALDWFSELRDAPAPMPFIQETLHSGSTEAVIAAGAVLAVLAQKGSVDVHPDVDEWCAGREAPPASLMHAAADAIQAIIEDPEAEGHDTWAELGEDAEDYLAWLANLRNIQARLR